MQSKLLIALLASCFASGAINAQSATTATTAAPIKKHGYFPQLDKNKDGVISRDEASAHPHMAQGFDMMDSNKDGSLSHAEMSAARSAMRGKMHAGFEQHFKAADANGDGTLSRSEVEASKMPGLITRFDRIDADKNGQLSTEEMQAMHGARKGGHHRMHGQGPDRHGKVDQFKAADFNGDGVVSKAEALSHAAQTFDRLDGDKDGKLTAAEVHAAHAGSDSGYRNREGRRAHGDHHAHGASKHGHAPHGESGAAGKTN